MRITVGLIDPEVVVNNFVAVPDVVVGVVRIVHAIVMMFAGKTCQRRSERCCKKQRTHWMRATTHVILSLKNKTRQRHFSCCRRQSGFSDCYLRKKIVVKWPR